MKGVDPINWAPVLAPKHQGKVATAELSDEAWRFFMRLIHDGYSEFPLKSAWMDTRDVGAAKGWAVPSFATFYRRWDALSEAQKLIARLGKEEALKRLSAPTKRDKTTIDALE